LSTLTKVFVVLLAFLSIALTPMIISFTAKTQHWKENYEAALENKKIAETNLRNLIASNAAELASTRDTIRALRADLSDLQQELQDKQNAVAELRAAQIQAASEKSSVEAINRGLLAQLQVAQAAADEYRVQRDDLEKRGIELERRNIDLNDRVNELTAQVAVLVEQKRQFEQQINILRTENEKLASALRRPGAGGAMEAAPGAAMPGVSAETPVAAAAIRGKVLDIEGNRVTISVGSADGVKKGMVFVIHRDGEYVGDVKISHVAPDQSAGRVIQSRLRPSPEDLVTDAVSIASSR
jgi:cell shape-determining protein MreC